MNINEIVKEAAQNTLIKLDVYHKDFRPTRLKILEDAFSDLVTKATEAQKTYENRVIELFGSWLDHWSIKINRETSEVYGAWDECRERAQKEIKSRAAPAFAEQQDEWRAGHDGCGTWGIYHGEEKRKGWSGNGKLLVSGISERQAKEIEAAHNG